MQIEAFVVPLPPLIRTYSISWFKTPFLFALWNLVPVATLPTAIQGIVGEYRSKKTNGAQRVTRIFAVERARKSVAVPVVAL